MMLFHSTMSLSQIFAVLIALSSIIALAHSIPLHKKNSGDDGQLDKKSLRVVNGVPVIDKEEYPFVVDLSAHPVAISSSRFCTGTLIRKNVVLTAAHCVLNDGYTTSVFATVGRIELHDLHEDNKEAKTFRTIASIVHPDYGGLGSRNDVALLLLNGTSSTKRVKLAAEAPKENEEAWVVGYGVQMLGTVEATGRPIEVLSGRLQKTALRIKDRSFCDIPQAELTTADGMLCTAGVKEGSSACKGDSGGGLFLHKSVHSGGKDEKQSHDKECVQVGIVSYGDSKCMSEDSGVFTDVASVKDWIDSSATRLQQVANFELIHLNDMTEKILTFKSSAVKGELQGNLFFHNSADGHRYGEIVKSYNVRTNFSKPRTLTVSLCEGEGKSRARLYVRNNHNGDIHSDNGSCPGGNLSQVSFIAEKGSYAVDVASEGNEAIQLKLSSKGL